MNCFSCFGCKEGTADAAVKEDSPEGQEQPAYTPPPTTAQPSKDCTDERASSVDGDEDDEPIDVDEGGTTAKAYTFRELASATKNFRKECLLGECPFGRIFRGTLQSSGQVVLVRQLERSATLESKEFQVEVLKLSLLQHPNLVRLIGYCADGEQRLLVYEYMPSGHVDKHLFDIPADRKPLKWSARMKIASGVAQGLEYLHEKADPPVIYRDLKSCSIMLDETNNPRLSDYGLLKLLQSGSKMHLSTQVTSSGYCAPEFGRDGELTLKSDVYSFGVVLLELISGRRALDSTLPEDDQSLVAWAQPIFKDPKRFPDMADPLLKGEYPVTSLNQAVGVAAMCLQEEPMVRPMISDIVAALSFLAVATPDMPIPTRLAPMLSARVDTITQHVNQPNPGEGRASDHKKDDSSDSEDDEDTCHSDDEYEDEQEDDDENDQNSDSEKPVKKINESGEWTSLSGKSKADSKCSSFGSMASSAGFSLRCDSTYPERELHAKQEVIHESHHFHSNSSSDEESCNKGCKSSSQVRRLESKKSKKRMSKKRQNSSISKSSVSSHSRNENVMESDDDDDGSDFVYSVHSSSVGSDYEGDDHSPEHEDSMQD